MRRIKQINSNAAAVLLRSIRLLSAVRNPHQAPPQAINRHDNMIKIFFIAFKVEM